MAKQVKQPKTKMNGGWAEAAAATDPPKIESSDEFRLSVADTARSKEARATNMAIVLLLIALVVLSAAFIWLMIDRPSES